MTPKNIQKIRELCGEDHDLADSILEVIEEDSRQHKEELARLQREGLRRARENGTRLGRPMIQKPRKFSKIYESYLNGEISARMASRQLGVSPGTFKRWADAEVRGEV